MRPRGAEHLTAFIVLLQEEVETTCTNQTLIAVKYAFPSENMLLMLLM